MMEFLIYDLKVAGCVAVFYMFYRLMLSRETLHRMNRVVLLSTAVASFVLPLCVITVHHTVVVPQTTGSVTAGLPMMAVVEESQPLWQEMLVALFFAGIAVTLGKMLWSIAQVVSLIRRSERHQQADGTVIAVTDEDVSPFSWMRYIVLNRKDYESPDPAIMAHERGHIRKRHSLDVILVDTLTVLQWFNPAMWMLRQDLRAIHEYEADAAVLSQGINMRQYQYLLIQKAVRACGYSVANGISHSTLKNRITMMLTNKKSTRMSWLKLLALLPIVGMTLALNAETVNDYVYDNSQQQPQKKVVKKGNANAQVKVGSKTVEVKKAEPAKTTEKKTVEKKTAEKKAVEKKAPEKKPVETQPVVAKETSDPSRVFDVVEEMPKFPGGDEGMMQFLNSEVKYPKEALEKGTQGRVVVTFIVNTDGSVSDPKVVKSVNPALDAEAIRVVNAMPKWTPGKQNGHTVRVKFTIPVTFRLK